MAETERPGEDLFEAGLSTRRAVLGEAHVARSLAQADPFDEPFQRLITQSAWGAVWSREGLTKRERSLITLALLSALGHHEELALHTRATANTGASADDIREALMHVAIYGGVPAANSAFRIVKRTLAEMEPGEGAR